MTNGEIRKAAEVIKTRKPCEERFNAEGVLLSLAEEYLKVEGWPEEKKKLHICGISKGCSACIQDEVNATIRLCKLSYLKEKQE